MIDQTAVGLLTVDEAAQVAEVAPATVRSWIHRYGLPTTRGVDGRVLVSELAVLDCELARRAEPRGRHRATAA